MHRIFNLDYVSSLLTYVIEGWHVCKMINVLIIKQCRMNVHNCIITYMLLTHTCTTCVCVYEMLSELSCFSPSPNKSLGDSPEGMCMQPVH